MIYIIMRKEISKYLLTAISCNHLFYKINKQEDEKVKLDFLLVYYISNEFIESYLFNKALSPKDISEINVPLNYARISH
ncbi:MAG: hypothetical protein QXZ44_06125 [Ferroplasma sp.]